MSILRRDRALYPPRRRRWVFGHSPRRHHCKFGQTGFFRVVVIAMFAGSAARGEPVADDSPIEPPSIAVDVRAPRTWVNLRGGFGNIPVDAVGARPQVCAELAPLDYLSVEACGTGAGLLFESAPEIAHFRSKLRLTSWRMEAGWFEPQLSAGFAELQVGDDSTGFDFFGTGPSGVATAGPEGGASMRWTAALPADFELLAEAAISMAYFARAPDLRTPMSPWQPSATVSVGVGW